MSANDVDKLVKFAEMMLGQLKSAEMTSHALGTVQKFQTGAELMQHKVSCEQFARLIQIGDEALAPFRSELTAL
jgi:hypothetical protein